MTFLGDENVFDCPARERRGECAAKLAEPDAVGIILLKALNKRCRKMLV